MNYLNAGIIKIKYEHILIFYRKFYIKHDDICILPGTLLVNINEIQFRIFYTNNIVVCYTRKSTDIHLCLVITKL